ncbi:MAG: glycosyltransferase, partial [Nitrospirota bacterium]
MADTAAISVVIPVYNGAAFVADAVASVRAQTGPVQEIIVVDDGSTDATAEAVLGLGEGVSYLYQENRGPGAARNRGVAAATGDWIAFLDADDRWTEGKLADQLDYLRQHPDVVMVSGDMGEIDGEGKILVESVLARHGQLERFRALDGRHIPAAVRELLAANFIPTGTVLVRRDVLVEVGGFHPYLRYGEDLELWCRIAARYPIACLPEILMWRRRHAANLSRREVPLLRELARVGEVIRGWGRGVLEVQGIDLDRWAAERHTDLGYALFRRDRRSEARAALWRALRTQIRGRAARYFALSCLPRPVLAALRKVTGRGVVAPAGRVPGGGLQPKRVLLVENGIGYGGAVVCLRHLVRNLDRARFAPLMVTGRRGGPYEALAEDGPWRPIRDRRLDVVAWKARLRDATWPNRVPGLRWVVQQLLARLDDLVNFVPFFAQLLWLALRFQPDLVHANNEPLCNRAAIFVAKVLRVPVVCHVRGQRDAGGLLPWLYRLPDHYF